MGVTRIHVYQQRIRTNSRLPPDQRKPPIIVLNGRKRRYGHSIRISGDAVIVYRPDAPLPNGARLWIETEGRVEVLE